MMQRMGGDRRGAQQPDDTACFNLRLPFHRAKR